MHLQILLCSYLEAATGGVIIKKLFSKISQYSQENTCVGVVYMLQLYQKVNIAKFLRTDFIEHLPWLLLNITISSSRGFVCSIF